MDCDRQESEGNFQSVDLIGSGKVTCALLSSICAYKI